MSKTRFSGSYVATITPFKSHVDEVDYEAFERLIDWQIGQGTNGLVPCGTTGESPTITDTEQLKLIELTVKISAGRAVVMAGTGANSTKEAIHLTTQAQKLGANASLQVVPYYNKPTQEGLYQHFKAIHDATDIPLILYNIPGRSVVQLSDETFQRLYELPRICGVKDATADLTKPLRIRQLFGDNFAQLSGEDATILPFLIQGGHGCISVTANIAPRLCAQLHQAWQSGNIEIAQAINEQLFPLHEAMFCETNPGPVKYAASLLGLTNGLMRLPMVSPSKASQERIKKAMEEANIL